MNRSTFSQTTLVVGWLFGIVAAAMALSPGAAIAQIAITVLNVSVPESSSTQTETFDVYVVTSGNSLPEVGDFTVNLQLSPASGVEFTGGAATSANPYIFAGQSPGPGVDILNSGTEIEGTDFASTPPMLVNGDGLLAVTYSVPANISGTFNLMLVTSGMAATALDDQNANPISFTVQDATLTVVPSTAYWNGSLGTSWNTLSGANFATNWSTTAAGTTDTHALPGTNTDVFFTTSGGGSNFSTTLSAPLSIKGLTFTSASTQPVSISGSALTIGADGLALQSGAAAVTINSPLTLNGPLSLAGQALTKTGSGTASIDAAPSLASGSTLAVSAGTLEFDVTGGTATIGSNVSVTVATAATLQLAGSVSALSDGSAINPTDGDLVNITNNGSTASGGGLQVTGTNQSVGIVSGQATTSGGATTYGGDTVVGNGASLTVTQLLQNSLTINAGATVTIRPSGSVLRGASVDVSANASTSATIAAISISTAPAVLASAPTLSASSSTIPTVAASASAVVASMPAAATPIAPISDPFLSVQNVISSGNNGATPVAVSVASVAPVQAAITSVAAVTAPASSADPIADSALSDAVASSGTDAADTSLSLLSIGQATTASVDATALIGADDNALLQFQVADSLALSGSPLGGLATIGIAVPTVDPTNTVPEPSSLVLLLLGCVIAVIFMSRPAWDLKRSP